ncbi:DUF1127 domain-containing protein [Celeribacter neptunius]|uniref:Uncharacterized conserved protein YjiS, DUF1127 family n=1 Tax=Celeribacter neptunius TaxID=588602 RepID=A0A1I3W161_9RHOB|nr:DUF1127 domain-containing protein [Celeribacter neptunius]SFK01160.1 Uncharacterized conserved protein YjiS, DUF1127 family [Celeribacter neptunius]
MMTLTKPMSSTVSSSSKGLTTSFFSGFSAYRNAMKTRKALEALSDHELNDIGLTRGDIARVAEGGFRRG